MKGKFIIVDLRSMDYMKNDKGEVIYYDTEEQASEVCGMYEFENVWILELKHNHKENLSDTPSEDTSNTSEESQKIQDRKELRQKFQRWLDTNPNKRIIAAQCAIIAEDYHQEQLSKILNS